MQQCILSTAYWAPVQYFTKFVLYNKILIEKHETYPKQSYRNRMLIYGVNKIQSLQVPVVKGSFKKISIKDIKISYDTAWQKNHLKTIESAYRSTPFYEFYIDDILPFYTKKYNFLLDYNTKILTTCFELLNTNTEIEFTDKFNFSVDIDDFRNTIHPKKIIEDRYFTPIKYFQGFEQRHGFIPNLSILDLIFNTGTDALSIIKKSCKKN
jgi:hypothetical protein